MYWSAAKSVVVSGHRWRSIGLLTRCHIPRRHFISYPPSLSIRNPKQINCFKDRKTFATNIKATKKSKESKYVSDKDDSHIIWWKEKMQMCRKPSSMHLINKLTNSNLLGLDDNLKHGSLKEGTLNCEILKFKSKFPREVLLCRVGEFYEAVGFDACILVEYAGLNPFCGLRSDGVPKAGCPVMNLRQTLDDLTRNGFSVVSASSYDAADNYI